MLYLYVKAFHIVFIVSWMAGIFYLPRLFVYHTQTSDFDASERFKIMERKLYRGIMWPAMIISLITGLWMLYLVPSWFSQGWLHAKLLFVFGLVAFHFHCGAWLKAFKEDRNKKSEKFFRIVNEAPVLLLIGIAIFVVVKPF